LKIPDLIRLAFQIIVIEMLQNKIENGEARFDEFKGVASPIANVLFLNGFINRFERELIDVAVVLERYLLEMMLLRSSFNKGMDCPSGFVLDQISELPLGEIPGVRSHDV
jgi:hypothetical protein